MSWREQTTLCAVVLTVLNVAACAGGGSGSGPAAALTPATTPTAPPPTPTPGPVVLAGIGQQNEFTRGPGNGAVVFEAPTNGPQTLTISIKSTGGLAALQMQTGSRNFTISSAVDPTDVLGCCTTLPDGSPGGLLKESGRGEEPGRVIAYANQSGGAWDYPVPGALQEYQTFGYWVFDDEKDVNRSGSVGSFSVGSATSGSNIPTTGAAAFSGKLLGTYLVGGTVGHEVAATMALNVNFSNRTASFSSIDWRELSTVYAGTALTGALSYSSQQNALTGQLTTANGALSGPVIAQFYGPNAQEVGGAFTLLPGNGGPDRMVGGFGAKR